MLLPSSYNPVTGLSIPDSLADTTDNAGHYSISATQTGSFDIEALDNNKGLRSLVTGVSVTGIDTTLVRDVIARIPGAIKIILPSGVDRGNGYFYIAGTTVYSFIGDDTENVVVNSVPAGVSLSLFYGVRGNPGQPQIVRQGVMAPANDTVTVAYAGWKFSKKLVFNTTTSGANVSGTVTEFPVLVRLTNSNFNFAEANGSGEDVRFTKANGATLPYEIETWDSSAGVAAVWVKVDTIFGNSGNQSVTMCWGNASAVSQSNGAAVFDTAAGFRGVWHMGEHAGAAVDATADNYSGTYAGSLPNRVPGAIGAGQSFDGAGDFADMGNVLNVGSSSFSISAWIKRGNASTVQAIAGKSNTGVPSATYGFSFAFYPADSLNIAVASGGTVFGDSGSFRVKANISITDTATWHHVAAVIDRSNSAGCRLFIDGIDRSGSVEGDITTVGALSNSLPFQIGEAADGEYPFAGSMDEVEMAYSARSADWIRLEYMNQKTNDQLIVNK
jgi:Concanavalin A-like lectin/glucanases superfamily/Domain of unknown function (DUF2341)